MIMAGIQFDYNGKLRQVVIIQATWCEIVEGVGVELPFEQVDFYLFFRAKYNVWSIRSP